MEACLGAAKICGLASPDGDLPGIAKSGVTFLPALITGKLGATDFLELSKALQAKAVDHQDIGVFKLCADRPARVNNHEGSRPWPESAIQP